MSLLYSLKKKLMPWKKGDRPGLVDGLEIFDPSRGMYGRYTADEYYAMEEKRETRARDKNARAERKLLKTPLPDKKVDTLRKRMVAIVDKLYAYEQSCGQYDVQESLFALSSLGSYIKKMEINELSQASLDTMVRELYVFRDDYESNDSYGGGKGSIGSALREIETFLKRFDCKG